MQAPDVLYRYNLTLFSDDAVVGRRFHRTEQVHLLFDYLNSNAGPAELRGARRLLLMRPPRAITLLA